MRKFILVIVFAILFLIVSTTISYGAYSAESKTVNSEEQFTVTVTSSVGLENFNLSLGGHEGITYVTCSSSAADFVNTASGQMAVAGIGKSFKTLGTYTFKAPNVTKDTTYNISFTIDSSNSGTVTSTITVKAPKVEEPKPEETPVTPAENTTPNNTQTNTEDNTGTQEPEQKPNENNNETPANTTTSNDNTQAEKPPVETKKSSNANLSNLGIRPNDFTGFKSGTTSYKVSVPNNVASVEVYAKKSEDSQTVTGTGTKQLNEGTNSFDVEVTAEDGTKKTYTINVVRLAKEETNNPDADNPKEEVDVALSSIQITSVSLNEAFNPEKLEYTAVASADAKEVIVRASANVENAKIEINAPEEFEDGENNIIITVKSESGSKSKTYTVKVTKSAEEIVEDKKEDTENKIIETIGATTSNEDNSNKDKNGLEKDKVIFIVGIGIFALIGAVCAFIRYRRDKNVDIFEDPEELSGMEFKKKKKKEDKTSDKKVESQILENSTEKSKAEKLQKGKHF